MLGTLLHQTGKCRGYHQRSRAHKFNVSYVYLLQEPHSLVEDFLCGSQLPSVYN